ncbi:MAG: class I SAM-dependent methyltransferase [Candidatus Nealsonbacteria bacterium]
MGFSFDIFGEEKVKWKNMAFLNPSRVLDMLDLKESFVAADFGSGSGGWVIPLAKRLKQGKVYAIDILEEPLSALKSKIRLEKILNIETIKSDVERTSKLLGNSCDLVLMTNLFFEVDDKKKVMEEGKRVLKKGGKLLVVDWKEDSPLGPGKKVSPEEIKKMAKETGLELEKEFSAGVYHWGLIFERL